MHSIAAATVQKTAISPYLNVPQQGWTKTSRSASLQPKACKSPSISMVSSCDPRLLLKPVLSSSIGRYSLSSEGLSISHLSAASSLLFSSDQGTLPTRSTRGRRFMPPPKAYLEYPFSIPYPKVIKKPKWWWRTLACVPYLMALQVSDAAFYFQPLMERYEQFEFLSYYVPGAIRRLPTWFLMVYCFAVYMGVVRNRFWPHFFRYHVMMGLLLENVLQIVWHASNFMPLIHYSGTYGLYYWAAVGTAFILLLLECVRCAVAGKYVNIPFVSDAAYIHTPYVKGD